MAFVPLQVSRSCSATRVLVRPTLAPRRRSLPAPTLRPRDGMTFGFHLRDGSQLLSIELPAAWCDSTVGRLQAFIAARRGLEGWACHLVTSRGPVDALLLVRAAIVRGEEVVLARGPSPVHGAEPTTRCTLWMWGRAGDGASCLPTAVQLWPHRISAVALGTEHALVVTDAGLVLAWGSNSHGQLGTGGDGKHTVATQKPRIVQRLAATHCHAVACGSHCSSAITSAEGLFTWGHHQPSNSPTQLEKSWVNRHGATTCGRWARAVAFGGSAAREKRPPWPCTPRRARCALASPSQIW